MTALFDRLVHASIEGGLLIAAVWLVCRLAPALPASLRVVVWWLATAKLLVGLAGFDPIALPILPTGAPAPIVNAGADARAYGEAAYPKVGNTHVGPSVRFDNTHAGASFSSGPASTDWRWWATCGWLATIGGLFLVALRQRHTTRRLIASAGAAEPRLLDIVDALAEQVGLARAPDTLRADRVESPMVAGLLAPVVLLPRARFDALPDVQQRMAICHELVHLRRGDLWLGCVPALAERLFFFHPLAHLAAREYLLAREAACDAAVLRSMNAAPQDYGRLLLALGVSPLGAGFAAASTSRSFSSLKRRITMLNQTPANARARYAGWFVAAVTACAVVPMQVVARTAPVSSMKPTPAVAPVASAPSAAATPDVQNVKPASKTSTRANEDGGKHLEFALILDDNHTIMNGWINDRRIAELRKAGDRVLWFKYQGKEYLTSDPAALRQAKAIYEPVSAIGAQQGEIGAKQGAIGAQQGNVGAQQGAIGARQGEIGAKQGAIGAKQGAIGAKQSRTLSEDERKELDAEMAKLDKEMRALDEQMKDLDREMENANQPMAELDAKMKELDVQMEALDKQMEAASAKADAEMDALLERLVQSGTAKAIK
jgi:bla regulator protein blaR1